MLILNVAYIQQELYTTAKRLADVIIPNEYGICPNTKLDIGAKICQVSRSSRHDKLEA